MPRRQNRVHVYILLVAVILAAIAAHFLSDKSSQTTTFYSHKDYIQEVEKSRSERFGRPQEPLRLDEPAPK